MHIILTFIFSSLILLGNCFGYAPKIDAEYKGGNKRHIGRYGILIPVYKIKSGILFTNLFLMHDSKSSIEGNFGLGLRKKYRIKQFWVPTDSGILEESKMFQKKSINLRLE
ncbi:MAG: hypothetical protein HRT87_02855 [Legionellales bacterium]|nr:hypothetical protein [Legionellales bacterium]